MWLLLKITWTFVSYNCGPLRNKASLFTFLIANYSSFSVHFSILLIDYNCPCLSYYNKLIFNIHWEFFMHPITFSVFKQLTVVLVRIIITQHFFISYWIMFSSFTGDTEEIWKKENLLNPHKRDAETDQLAQITLNISLSSWFFPAVGLINCSFNNQHRQSCLIRGWILSDSVSKHTCTEVLKHTVTLLQLHNCKRH